MTQDSNQRAGNGSGVVVMSARCMPVTIAPGLRPPHLDFPSSPVIGALARPAGAATIILDGVRSGAWRILVGQDAASLDGYVRAKPEAAYDYALLASMAPNAPRPGGLASRSPGSTGNPDATAGGRVLP